MDVGRYVFIEVGNRRPRDLKEEKEKEKKDGESESSENRFHSPTLQIVQFRGSGRAPLHLPLFASITLLPSW